MRLNPLKNFSVAFAGGQFFYYVVSVEAKKAHQMLFGWGIVIVFPILFGECRSAFVEHSGQDHVLARQLSFWIHDRCRFLDDRSEEAARRLAAELLGITARSAEEGKRLAQDDFQKGILQELAYGKFRDIVGTCVPCRVRWRFSPERIARSRVATDRCILCNGLLVPLETLGCLVGDTTRGTVAGYNRAVENHLRAGRHADFSWEQVTSQEV